MTPRPDPEYTRGAWHGFACAVVLLVVVFLLVQACWIRP